MFSGFRRAAPLGAACLLAVPSGAMAHAVCGPRTFPVTLTLDDPGVSDEASLPTFTYQHFGDSDAQGATNSTTVNLEYDKRVTENFGLGINAEYDYQQIQGSKNQSGWQDVTLTAKYQHCFSEDHEFIVSVGVQREFGRTGRVSNGADEFGGTAPTLYFGKGFGDLPVDVLRPFAVTGELSYTWADRALKLNTVTDPVTGNTSVQSNNGNSNAWFGGVSLQYSIPYLQAQVKDYGLPPLFAHAIPIVEFTWVSPGTSPSDIQTAWTMAPGVIWMADWYQVGVEALVPLNKAAGTNVGVVAQFHVFLDDLLPNTLGKPIVEWFE
jgi:hypothetical protein